MADVQLFSNNARSTLAAESLAVDTTIELVSSAGFSAPAAGQYELATLTNAAGTLIEIVKITANTANLLTVVRAQEGTAALDWPVGTLIDGRVTAGTLSRMAQGFDNDGNARGQFSVNLQPGRDIATHVASGDQSVTVGYDTEASGGAAICIGNSSRASGVASIAIGASGQADSYYAVVIGSSHNRVEGAIMIGHFPVIKMDDDDAQNEQFTNAPEVVICSPDIDIGEPPAWQASTNYLHGDIVQPTTPNGFQYKLWAPDHASVLTAKQMIISGLTEPIWPVVVGDSVAENSGACWVCQQPDELYALQAPPYCTVFIPTQFGFLCQGAFTALTGTPSISVGTAVDSQLYVVDQAVPATATDQCHVLAPVATTPIPVVTNDNPLTYYVNRASAGRCVGRFFVRGFFVELPVHG